MGLTRACLRITPILISVARPIRLQSLPEKPAAFIEPMECELTSRLHDGEWVFEIKLDGYRAVAVKSASKVNLFSRRHKFFNSQYPAIVEALTDMPDETVLDGEIVALDDSGRPRFNLLQNYRRESDRIRYFVFDLLCFRGRDTMQLPLSERRQLLRGIRFGSPKIQLTEYQETTPATMIEAVKGLGLEGVVGKRKDSPYQPGRRTGLWVKYKINQSQEFVIGGYFPGLHGFDSIIIGYYKGKDLMYAARTRNGFVPASRRQVFSKLKPLIIEKCPFVNLPESHESRFGEPLDAEKMKKAVWVGPELVAQIEFLEWTEAERLRHSKFVGLREDKWAQDVVKEN